MFDKFTRSIRSGVALLASAVILAGCLGEEGSPDDTSNGNPAPPPTTNQPPSISGNPSGAVLIGQQYSFTPSASDPDNDTLTFSISGQPSWATFDTSNGRLSGTPTLGSVGLFEDIQISVSDGSASASLSPFSINVADVANGSTSLSWSAPTQNVDGSSLTDLAGYTIYYGTSPGTYSEEIRIDNPSLSTYTVDNLVPNTYYFAMTAFNAADEESRLSGEAVIIVN